MSPTAEQPISKKSSLILYVGNDRALHGSLREEFRKILGAGIACEMLEFKSESEVQPLIVELQKRRPKLIILDLSLYTAEVLHVVRVLERMNSNPKTATIAVVDGTQDYKIVKQAILAGVNSVHIKSGELDALVFGSIAMGFNDKFKEHEFAQAKFEDQAICYVPGKVSLINQRYIQVESNFKTTPGNSYYLESEFTERGVTHSSLMKCHGTTTDNLFYNYTYSHRLLWPIVQYPSNGEDAQNKEVSEEPNHMLAQWITDRKDISRPKPVKTLVIDKELRLFKSIDLSDSFEYILRAQPFLLDPEFQLRKVMPQVIFFEMHGEPGDLSEDELLTCNTLEAFKLMIKAVKEIEDFEPYIIVSNSKRSTQDLQKRENYSNLMGYPDSISPELITKMSAALKKKLSHNDDKMKDAIVFDKKSIFSTAEFKINIELKTCSELDLTFTSIENFAPGTNLRLEFPVPMHITIIDAPGGKTEAGVYYALVNGIKGEDKTALRRFVNSVFFRQKEEAKAKEKEEYIAKNEKYTEDEKKAAADKAQKEKEEAEKKAQADKDEEERKAQAEQRNKAAKELEDKEKELDEKDKAAKEKQKMEEPKGDKS